MDKVILYEKFDVYLKGCLDVVEQVEVCQFIDFDKDVVDQLELVCLEQELVEVLVDEKLDEMMKLWDEEEFFFNVVFDSFFKFNVSKFLGKWIIWGFVIIVFIGLLIWFWFLGEESEVLNVVIEMLFFVF